MTLYDRYVVPRLLAVVEGAGLTADRMRMRATDGPRPLTLMDASTAQAP